MYNQLKSSKISIKCPEEKNDELPSPCPFFYQDYYLEDSK